MTQTTTSRAGLGARGFTLIELMITVAIVGILAALAYPAYNEQVAKGRRAEMLSNLMQASQWMERFYAENYRYDTTAEAVPRASSTMIPFKLSPATGTTQYTLVLSSVTRTSYVLTATPAAGGRMLGDKCGNFQLNSTGARAIMGSPKWGDNSATALQECWK